MRVLAIFALAFVALIAAERDWTKIINKELKVSPIPGHRIPHKPSTWISNGKEAVRHSKPWQVGLIIPTLGPEAFCGGFLIDAQNVLTAAHCITEASGPIEVVLGAHNIREDETTQVTVSSDDYLSHEQYDKDRKHNDVGLIRLPSPVTLNENIQPLPIDTSSCSDDYVGQDAIVSGWGRDSDADTWNPSVLREVTLPVISNDKCAEVFGSVIQPTHICTDTAGGKSPCGGDSGGPLILNGNDIGIVSFGSDEGCELGHPAVFSRVCQFSSWIEQHKKKEEEIFIRSDL